MKIEPISYYHVTLDEPKGMEIDVTLVGVRASAYIVTPTRNEDGNKWNQTHEGLNHCNKAIEAVMAHLGIDPDLESVEKNVTASIPLDPDKPEPETALSSAEEVAASADTFKPIVVLTEDEREKHPDSLRMLAFAKGADTPEEIDKVVKRPPGKKKKPAKGDETQ